MYVFVKAIGILFEFLIMKTNKTEHYKFIFYLVPLNTAYCAIIAVLCYWDNQVPLWPESVQSDL